MRPHWPIVLLLLLASAGSAVGAATPDAPDYLIVGVTAASTQASTSASAGQSPKPFLVQVGTRPRFELEFVDVALGTGSGFDDPMLGERRRDVAVAAFEMAGHILAGETGSARIRLDSDSPYFGEKTLAIGLPLFQCVDGFQKPIIFDALRNDVHIHDYEGALAVNFTQSFNDDLATPESGKHDLYTTILHEVIHVLGFVGFSVEADGRPRDCGGARMLPAIASQIMAPDGLPMWVSDGGKIRFRGQADDLPSAQRPLPLDMGEDGAGLVHLAASTLQVRGHWHDLDFAQRTGTLMADQSLPAGAERRNLTPETKAVLNRILGYTTGSDHRGLTGSWFDPASSGQGFSLHTIAGDRFVVYFYGFTDSGERLWLVGLSDDPLHLGGAVTVELLQADGGSFNGFDAGLVEQSPWGRLDIRFDDCLNAQATLSGDDGTQHLSLQRLAGVDGLHCY
ncbi:MAG: hypothetical protein GTO48_10615 [Xanthomonadales bacterium]|nr:hypothetical protein [Xanthomonadales bacterium]NIO14938.1 hypothetical protein [Xanthomonadales bacterium]NIP77175.1 hypothetical protein [Xanthomonadales bacterium]NIT08152.1 hypothetical protein [Xanthomonadales bacterium]